MRRKEIINNVIQHKISHIDYNFECANISDNLNFFRNMIIKELQSLTLKHNENNLIMIYSREKNLGDNDFKKLCKDYKLTPDEIIKFIALSEYNEELPILKNDDIFLKPTLEGYEYYQATKRSFVDDSGKIVYYNDYKLKKINDIEKEYKKNKNNIQTPQINSKPNQFIVYDVDPITKKYTIKTYENNILIKTEHKSNFRI